MTEVHKSDQMVECCTMWIATPPIRGFRSRRYHLKWTTQSGGLTTGRYRALYLYPLHKTVRIAAWFLRWKTAGFPVPCHSVIPKRYKGTGVVRKRRTIRRNRGVDTCERTRVALLAKGSRYSGSSVVPSLSCFAIASLSTAGSLC